MMSSFKEKLRKVWNALAFGHHQPGRFFVHKKKFYVLERYYGSLLFSSRSVRKAVLDGILLTLKQPPVIVGLLAGAGFVVGGIVAGSFAVASIIGLMVFVLTLYLIVQIYTGGDEGSIPVLVTGSHKKASEYAGQEAGKIAEILPHLTKEQIVQMVENLEELRKVEDLIVEADGFMAENPDSLLASDVRAQIDMLKVQEKKLLQSQKLDEAMHIYDSEIAYKKEEKVINLLQRASQYTSEKDSSFTEISLALQSSESPCVEEVSVPMPAERSRAR